MRALLNFVLEITDIAGKCKKPAADVSNLDDKEGNRGSKKIRSVLGCLLARSLGSRYKFRKVYDPWY